jgi:UDPglucose 6-dehydrogenase
MKKVLKAPVLIDLRNVYVPAEMIAAGFQYSCVGRPVA